VVTAKAQYNLKNAEQYFGEHLSVGDYYDEGQLGLHLFTPEIGLDHCAGGTRQAA
jgi:hypothetical protein